MIIRLFIGFSLIFFSCGAEEKDPKKVEVTFSLDDFYSENKLLDDQVQSFFSRLDPKERIGQMIVTSAGTTGKPSKTVEHLIKNKTIGGVLMLSGEKDQISRLVRRFDSLASIAGAVPLIFSSDAEPSLINVKIKGTQKVPKTVELETPATCDSVAQIISNELRSMGIQHNLAPVVDFGPDNEAITNRTFGNDSMHVVGLSSVFIRTSQKNAVVATAKHFPGHGLVSGDTHNQLVTIDGEMKEVVNYIPLIGNGVLSIMIGHIAVKNNPEYNSDDLPASCSRVIVTDLLKKELGFKGIIITDAMNMGALRKIDQASLKAVEAGCDMILMEPNEKNLLEDVYNKYMADQLFKAQVDQSVKKILRLKACLNLL